MSSHIIIPCSNRSHNRCSIRFNLIRVPLQAMHYAIDEVEVGTIYPATNPAKIPVDTPTYIKKCLNFLEKLQHMSFVTLDQRNAIASMVDPTYTKVWMSSYRSKIIIKYLEIRSGFCQIRRSGALRTRAMGFEAILWQNLNQRREKLELFTVVTCSPTFNVYCDINFQRQP